MNPEERLVFHHYIPVPKELHSFETGERFSRCVDCGRHLLEDGTPYLIQKAFKGREVLVEFAYCVECHDQLAASYSKETMTRIWNFLLDSANIEERVERLSAATPTSLSAWTEHCLTCGRTRSQAATYTLLAQCDGPDLIFHYLPYMFCESCQMKMTELMSAASRDSWDRWIEENLDVPPSVQEDIRRGRIAFV